MKRFALLALIAWPALAHNGESFAPDDLWSGWSLEPGIVVSLFIPAALYAAGARRSRGVSRESMLLFWSGMAILALALLSPIHPLGEVLFSAHMAQHEILMMVAAPLLVLSRPLVPMLWALPLGSRRAVGRWSKRPRVQAAWQILTKPAMAWGIHAAALWVWHLPSLFQATLSNEWIHAAQHASFFGSALLFWWSLLSRRASTSGAGVLYVFTTGVHTSVLGALLTFSPRLWYPLYASHTSAWGLTPLEDQQIGGLIMWVPAGLIYLVIGLWLFAKWMRESELRASTRMEALIGSTMLVVLVVQMTGCLNSSEASAATLTGGDPHRGAAAISGYGCGTCHTIPGLSDAHGLVGPPLAGLRHRTYVAGMLDNTPQNLVYWIRHPKQVNPHTAMPELGVTSKDAYDIAAYLYTDR